MKYIDTPHLPTIEVFTFWEDGKIPERKTDGAAGYDLYAYIEKDIVICSGGASLVPTGIKMQLPKNFEAQLRPRSSLAMSGVVIPNSPGTIDSDYRGEIKVLLANYGSKDFTVRRADRIAQLVFAKLPAIQIDVVSQLSKTSRGSGGFGSTGR